MVLLGTTMVLCGCAALAAMPLWITLRARR
jgi:hypothetical protein